MSWGALSQQIEAILSTARREAESRVLEAQIQAEEILADANVAGQWVSLEASAHASRMVDEARADLAYARALRDSSQRQADEVIERSERAALDRWVAADEHLRAFAEATLGDSLSRVKAICAELSGAQDLLHQIMNELSTVPDLLRSPDTVSGEEPSPG
ncbi:MAG: hypothetical protein ACTHN0_07205 [Aquihabitans sp.]